tara:strand:+ start:1236 stop:2141 length:906 start_codon:yes stop_codon:yes gene_type:complete
MLKKIYYKLFKSKDRYNKFKSDQIIIKQQNLFEEKFKNKLFDISHSINNKKTLNFLHSGHCGDLIYSLALIKELSKSHKCNLFIGVGKKIEGAYFKHPANGVYIDNRIANQILPLLKFQSFLNEVKIHNEENIDIDLDLFRDLPINLNFNSCRWYFHLTGANVDLSVPYLNSTEHKSVKDKIVILRTFRYRNHFINYKFLNKVNESIIFIGLKEEFEDLKKDIPKLQHYEPENFFEMSQIIRSSKFFLGNQSPAFAIAEALKVPRLLECSPDFTVVHPIGGNCYDFYFQIHFEKWIKKLIK